MREQEKSKSTGTGTELIAAARRSLSEFLALPTAIVAGFLVLALATRWLEGLNAPWLETLRSAMTDRYFGDEEVTGRLLETLAAGLITLTSITFSVLLLAVQQAAASMTPQIIDQFLRRRLNQLFFGFFAGLSLYALLVLSTVQPGFNPVIGAGVALGLSVVALYGLIVLIYATITQVRPASIVEAVHGHTLRARLCRRELFRSTLRAPSGRANDKHVPVTATENGFLVEIELDLLAQAAGDA